MRMIAIELKIMCMHCLEMKHNTTKTKLNKLILINKEKV